VQYLRRFFWDNISKWKCPLFSDSSLFSIYNVFASIPHLSSLLFFFLQIGNNSFQHITSTDFLVYKETKQTIPLVVFFSRHFKLAYRVLSCSFGGDLTACRMYKTVHNHVRCWKCPPSAWTRASQTGWLYFNELSTRSPCQTIIVIRCYFNVRTSSLGNGDEYEKKNYFHFCFRLIPQ
jgi:hypothetical protein